MKKNQLTLLIVIVLTIIAGYFIYQENNGKISTIRPELRNFSIEDTAAITKIFLADKTGKNVTLEKIKSGEWKVNDKYIARLDAVTLLLKTTKNLEVKNPVGVKARDNIIKSLASGGTKVEFYKGDQLVKLFYVGGETQDHMGTFMLLADVKTMENSSVPFVVELPGFQGYLTTRFFTKEADWRDRAIFKYNPLQLKNVKVEFKENPANSFEISILGNNKFSISSIISNKPLPQLDTMAVKQYLSYYQSVYFEGIDESLQKATRDSIIASIPFSIITITDTKGNDNSVKIFQKEAIAGSQDEKGNSLKYDPGRLYALINDEQDFVVIQYYTFGKLLQPIDYFKLKSPGTVKNFE